MRGKLILSHDLGTSGNKATLYTAEGSLLESVVVPYAARFFNSNWAEQAPADWWKAVCEATQIICSRSAASDIAVVSFSGQMMGCLCVDKNGEPLRDSIIWADQRSTEEEQFIRRGMDPGEFYRITGHRPSATYGAEKLLWIKKNEPETFRRTFKMLNAKDYIILKLTGKFVTDYSDAGGTNLFDLNGLCWSARLLELTGLDPSLLPGVMPSASIAGEVNDTAAAETGLLPGTLVACGAGDGVCATVGSGCVRPGQAYLYFGSSAWVSCAAENPLFDREMRVFTWPHAVPGAYSPCGTMQGAGASLAWLKDNICLSEQAEAAAKNISPFDIMTGVMASSPPGSRGLLYLPYLLGERSPWWNPEARGCFVGLKMEHSRADFLRSVLEGVIFNLCLILDVFREQVSIKDITAIGGGSKSALSLQIMANIFGLPVRRALYLEEATSLGAAVIGGVAAGLIKDFAGAENFNPPAEVIVPDESSSAGYAELKPVFEEAYRALVPVYAKLASREGFSISI